MGESEGQERLQEHVTQAGAQREDEREHEGVTWERRTRGCHEKEIRGAERGTGVEERV